MQRQEVERAIEAESGALASVTGLLLRRVPFDRWPAAELRLLRAAMTGGSTREESARARLLVSHLFRGDRSPANLGSALAPLGPEELDPMEQRQAERLRADLVGCVPLGAGCAQSTDGRR